MSRIGRRPQGAKLVEHLAGSDYAKGRLAAILKTLAGELSVVDACRELGIVESRFYLQRAEWLQEAVSLLEPGTPGRPRKPAPSSSAEELQTAQARIRELEGQLAAEQVRSELAEAVPHVLHRAAAKRDAAKKRATRLTRQERAAQE